MELGAADAQESADERAQIAVLSADELLLGALRNAAPMLEIHSASSVGDLARLLGSRRCRALAVDLAAVTGGGLDLIPRLAALFPELPLIVIAAREDERTVEVLLSRGIAERFLMKPIAPLRARTLLTEAVRQGRDDPVDRAPRLEPAAPAAGPTLDASSLPSRTEAAVTVPPARAWISSLTPARAAGLAAAAVLLAAIVTAAALRDDGSPSATTREASGGHEAAARNRAEVVRSHTDAAELATLLAAGDLALARGALVAPIGASAMDYYRRAATLDPSSRAARTGLAAIADALLRDAEAAFGRRRYPEAESAARAASLVAPDDSRVATLLARISDAATRASTSGGRPAAPRPQALAARESRPVRVATPPASTARPDAAGGPATSATALPPASVDPLSGPGGASAGAVPELPRLVTAPEPAHPADRRGAGPAVPGAVAAAPLRRIAGNAPRYPMGARGAGVTGWVDLAFVVGPNGVPQDVRVVRSEPAGTFDDSARRAVQSWRYAPPARPQPANVRVRFDLK
jgi:protein TonB